MADIAQLHRRALDETRSVVAGTERGQWADTTPCDGWDVQALLSHLVSGNLWAAELGSGRTIEEVGDRLDGDVLGNDALAAYDASAKAAAAAFEAPGALDAPCGVSYGPVPRFGVRRSPFHRCPDSRMGPGNPRRGGTTLDPELVDAAYRLLQDQADMVRASGMFGEDILVPAGVGLSEATAPRSSVAKAEDIACDFVASAATAEDIACDFAASAATAGRRPEVGFRGLFPLCQLAAGQREQAPLVVRRAKTGSELGQVCRRLGSLSVH